MLMKGRPTCKTVRIRLTFLLFITACLIPLSFGYRPKHYTPISWTRFSTGSRNLPPPPPSFVGDAYDFIIVGGGTAGAAVARRLAESGKHSVLILEYGDYPNPGLDIPALFGKYLNDENRQIYKSVRQTDGSLSNNGTFSFLIGRMLGGTSGLNGMFVNRGSPYNYNEWATITGDPSWDYANLLKYFRKMEDYQGDFPSSSQHGYGGPITVSRPSFAPGLEQWLKAGKYLGFPIADPNGPQQVSFTTGQFSKRFGRRVSSYTGYLKPWLDEKGYGSNNLKIIVKAEVERVIFVGNKAIGVIYSERGGAWRQNIFVRANKEVILSAGVINSPVILMKSGIGPRPILRAHNVPVLKSLPVGRNLIDHMTLRLNIVLGNSSATFLPERDLTPENFRLYNETGEGPYSSYQGTPGQAFTTSTRSVRTDWPDIQISFLQSPAAAAVVSNDETKDIELAPWEALAVCAIYLVGPKSKGYLMLNSTHPDRGDPIINFRYLSHPDDIQVLKEAVKQTLTIFEDTPAYQKMGTRYPPNPERGCAHLQFRSDAYWECYIRHRAGSGCHGVGTCRMGREKGDPEAVVNPQLKVLGFHSLRVVDASIMPTITNANTQAAVYVIAEKAADMILQTWN